ncbi:MAG: phosphate signaling complex PhoU family protein [Evtepia gabavorous]
MREKFKQQLEEMYRQMVIMGSLCQQAIAVAVRTLDEEEDRAEKLEAQVFAVDGEIDDMEREIEALCTKLLLKQQPVAADLRRITAALKMVTDLERIGDQASDIAELARFIRKGSAQPPETDGGGGHPDGQRERGRLCPAGSGPGPGGHCLRRCGGPVV